MDGTQRTTRVPSRSEGEILTDISTKRVTRETAAAMWDHLVPGDLTDAAGAPLEESEASDIRTQFMDAVEALAEIEIPHANVVLSQVFVPALVERASRPYEFLVSHAREGSDGENEVVRLLLHKARLFNPAHPATAVDAYERSIEARPDDVFARYELGRLLHRIGELDRAERAYRELLALSDVKPVFRSMTLEGLSAAVEALGRTAEARELLGEAAREAESWMDSLAARIDEEAARTRAANRAEVERLDGAAKEASARGDHHAADAALGELLGLQRRSGWRIDAAHTIWRLASNAVAAGYLDAADERFRGAEQAFAELGEEAALAGALYEHAEMAGGRGQFDEAEELLERTLELEKKLGDTDSAIVTMVSVADVKEARGEPKRAIKWLEKALDLAEESGNARREGEVATSLASAARKREDGKAERKWTERAIAAFERSGDEALLAGRLEWLSRLDYSAGEFESSVAPGERARAIYERLGDREGLGRTLSLLGAIDMKRRRFESSERILRLAAAIHQERFDNETGAVTWSALGDLAHRRGDADAAREAWQKALARYSNVDMWDCKDAQRIRRRLGELP